MALHYVIRVRVEKRIIVSPGLVIGQGLGPGPWVVTCDSGGGGTTPKKASMRRRLEILE